MPPKTFWNVNHQHPSTFFFPQCLVAISIEISVVLANQRTTTLTGLRGQDPRHLIKLGQARMSLETVLNMISLLQSNNTVLE